MTFTLQNVIHCLCQWATQWRQTGSASSLRTTRPINPAGTVSQRKQFRAQCVNSEGPRSQRDKNWGHDILTPLSHVTDRTRHNTEQPATVNNRAATHVTISSSGLYHTSTSAIVWAWKILFLEAGRGGTFTRWAQCWLNLTLPNHFHGSALETRSVTTSLFSLSGSL